MDSGDPFSKYICNKYKINYYKNIIFPHPHLLLIINPLTPMSDQDRISPYNINKTSSRKVTRVKKNIN